jgi:Tfp pilus assembly protein PilN
MIKINLATKKQIIQASADSKGLPASSEDLKELGSRAILPLILMAGIYFGSEYYFQMKKDGLGTMLIGIQTEKQGVEAQLGKFSGFESQKAELEKTADAINLKITTIEKLIRNKDATYKTLLELSQALPKDVWLTDFEANDQGYLIQGATKDISMVSDLMEKLGTSIYFKNVTLKRSQLEADGKVASFELTAGRI